MLEGVDLALDAGQVTAVVGPNAAGKSTLIKCILGLVRPSGGAIEVLGQPVRERSALSSLHRLHAAGGALSRQPYRR